MTQLAVVVVADEVRRLGLGGQRQGDADVPLAAGAVPPQRRRVGADHQGQPGLPGIFGAGQGTVCGAELHGVRVAVGGGPLVQHD